jgi:hypothetical protein
MVKDTHMLLAAYDDAAGVTAKFNKNLRRLLAEFKTKSEKPSLYSIFTVPPLAELPSNMRYAPVLKTSAKLND